jgi:uncharacterized protein YdcH (DUF465 family)
MATLEQKIQKWVSIDDKIMELNNQIKTLRENKNSLSEIIFSYVDKNPHLKNMTLHISNEKVKFTTTNVMQPLTFKYVEKSLGEIIANSEQVDKIISYLKTHRENKSVSEIKRCPPLKK